MRANTVIPFALTWASRRFTVSFGPWLLRIVINPSAAIACAPHSHIAAANATCRGILRRPAARRVGQSGPRTEAAEADRGRLHPGITGSPERLAFAAHRLPLHRRATALPPCNETRPCFPSARL